MSVRNLRLSNLSRGGAVIAAGRHPRGDRRLRGLPPYKKATTTTVIAYFTDTMALYPDDRVQIMGVPVGKIDSIEAAGDKMKVTLSYDSKYKVPAEATASILNPTVVASG